MMALASRRENGNRPKDVSELSTKLLIARRATESASLSEASDPFVDGRGLAGPDTVWLTRESTLSKTGSANIATAFGALGRPRTSSRMRASAEADGRLINSCLATSGDREDDAGSGSAPNGM